MTPLPFYAVQYVALLALVLTAGVSLNYLVDKLVELYVRMTNKSYEGENDE